MWSEPLSLTNPGSCHSSQSRKPGLSVPQAPVAPARDAVIHASHALRRLRIEERYIHGPVIATFVPSSSAPSTACVELVKPLHQGSRAISAARMRFATVGRWIFALLACMVLSASGCASSSTNDAPNNGGKSVVCAPDACERGTECGCVGMDPGCDCDRCQQSGECHLINGKCFP